MAAGYPDSHHYIDTDILALGSANELLLRGAMHFFEETEGAPERIGKAIGTLLAALIYVAVIALMLGPLLR